LGVERKFGMKEQALAFITFLGTKAQGWSSSYAHEKHVRLSSEWANWRSCKAGRRVCDSLLFTNTENRITDL